MAKEKRKWRRTPLVLPYLAILTSLIIVSAVSWHSVGEIHYLKTFYPRQFTVEQAFYASGVELVKVLIIGLPCFFIIVAALGLVYAWRSKPPSGAE